MKEKACFILTSKCCNVTSRCSW